MIVHGGVCLPLSVLLLMADQVPSVVQRDAVFGGTCFTCSSLYKGHQTELPGVNTANRDFLNVWAFADGDLLLELWGPLAVAPCFRMQNGLCYPLSVLSGKTA